MTGPITTPARLRDYLSTAALDAAYSATARAERLRGIFIRRFTLGEAVDNFLADPTPANKAALEKARKEMKEG